MDDNELFHYGKLGMRWGRHMKREIAAERANRAHEETERVRKAMTKPNIPLNRMATDMNNRAQRTGKPIHVKMAKIANSRAKTAAFMPNKIIGLYEKKEGKRDTDVKRANKIISEIGELKIGSNEFDRWLERH